MFRKSVFIVLFVCLLATISSAFTPSGNYPWDNQIDWKAGTDANWYNPANWTQAGANPVPSTGPGQNNEVCVSPDQPGPRLGMSDATDATAAMLMLNGWDPTSWGPQDLNVTVLSTAGNINFGAAIQINAWVDYDSYLGTTDLVNRAILNVYGGTVTTPYQYNNSTNVSGMRIGGGASNYSNAYGLVNMTGGQIIVPNLDIYFGDINLWGGTITVTGDPNFYISPSHFNQVKMDGGTLVVAGNHTADLGNYIANGNIVSDRGTLGTPTYDGSAWTTITSIGNLRAAWYPQPVNGATEVRYLATNTITLTWNKGYCVGSDGNEVNIIHYVYFGTSPTSLTLQGSLFDPDPNNDPCSWTVIGPFAIGTSYYWEVNEYNVPGGVNTPGAVWTFKTQDGKAYNPRPQNGQNGLKEPLTLSWTAGDWTQSTGGHRVYFGTDYSTISLANTSTTQYYRGTVSTTSYRMSSLYPDWTLSPGTTYYWRVDEVNNTTVYKGPVWSFIPAPYINIDDFEDYNTTGDLNALGDPNIGWLTGYTVYRQGANINGCTGSYSAQIAKGKFNYVRDSAGKHMNFTYIDEPSTYAFSEVNRPYIGGTVFTSNLLSPAPAAIRVDYIGTNVNAADPCYDRMYIALEDTAGNIAVKYNPDANAAKVGVWTQWYTALSDGNLASVNMAAVDGFRLGFGNRLGCMDNETGGDGNVMFDNIRLYAKTCNPTFAQTADMDGDCDVDINDLSIFANDWLVKANIYTFAITAPKTPVLWYKFDDSGMSSSGLATDSGKTGTYTGTVVNVSDATWSANGKYNGCLYLPSGASSTVSIPTSALGSFISDSNHPANSGGGISFSVWINADMTSNNMQTSWNGLICIRTDSDNVEALELECPIPFVPANNYSPRCDFVKKTATGTAAADTPKLPNGNFGGAWNHWAFIKNPDHMLIYCNGNLVGNADTNEAPNDPNIGVYGPLWYDPNISTFRIGARGGNWGMWNGYIDDFRMYDYDLSPAEVAYIATNGTGQILVPLVSLANLYLDGVNPSPSDANQIVNFEDLSVMGIQWHTIQLWP